MVLRETIYKRNNKKGIIPSSFLINKLIQNNNTKYTKLNKTHLNRVRPVDNPQHNNVQKET